MQARHQKRTHESGARRSAIARAKGSTMNLPPEVRHALAFDSLELQLASALQRLSALQRRAASQAVENPVLARTLAELSTALEHLRLAQEQIHENHRRLEEVQAELCAERTRYCELFDEMPQPYVVTTRDTVIVEANPAAAELLNVSQRFLVGKALSVFVCENRAAFLTESSRIGDGQSADTGELTLKVRPRERAPLTVVARARGSAANLRWALFPVSSPTRKHRSCLRSRSVCKPAGPWRMKSCRQTRVDLVADGLCRPIRMA
jgi:PAS domain-containing protein